MTQDNPPTIIPPSSDTPPEAQTVPAAQNVPQTPAVPAAPVVPADTGTPAGAAEAVKAEVASPAPALEPTVAAAPDPCADGTSRLALVVDDEPANRDFLVRLLEQAQLEVKGAIDAADALNKLVGVACVRLIAIDHKLPDMDGVDLLAQLRPRYPHARLIMATMHDDRALMEKAFANGCDVFLVKPHGFMELFRRVQLLDSKADGMQKLIIDQYGPRPYRG